MNTALGIVLGALAYAALAVCVAGTTARVIGWLRTPQRLPIPVTPAPTTWPGVCLRVGAEALFFRSLFRATRWTWLFGWTFHVALLLAIAGHVRYFAGPVDRLAPAYPRLAAAVGAALLASIGALWLRRVLIARIRYVSTPSDHGYLVLLAAIAASGLALGTADAAVLAGLKNWVHGLAGARLAPFPADPVALGHVSGVIVLLFVFPFGKLVHAPGAFLIPTRAAPDRSRIRRTRVPAGPGAA